MFSSKKPPETEDSSSDILFRPFRGVPVCPSQLECFQEAAVSISRRNVALHALACVSRKRYCLCIREKRFVFGFEACLTPRVGVQEAVMAMHPGESARFTLSGKKGFGAPGVFLSAHLYEWMMLP